MPDSFVLDASVAAKLFFNEPDSDLARAIVRVSPFLISPDLIFMEMASIAAKTFRRGDASREEAREAVDRIDVIPDEIVPASGLRARAYEIAAEYGFSAYDGSYLALSEICGFKVLTADMKLIRRANAHGFHERVHPLQ